MSVVISKENLEEEGELLFEKLRVSLEKKYIDFFRSNFPVSLEKIRDYFEEKYTEFFRSKFPVSLFEKIKEIKQDHKIAESDAIDEQLEREKTAPSEFFRPNLESIARVFELIDIDKVFDGDLLFDVKLFLKKYEIYQDLISV